MITDFNFNSVAKTDLRLRRHAEFLRRHLLRRGTSSSTTARRLPAHPSRELRRLARIRPRPVRQHDSALLQILHRRRRHGRVSSSSCAPRQVGHAAVVLGGANIVKDQGPGGLGLDVRLARARSLRAVCMHLSELFRTWLLVTWEAELPIRD